MSAAVKKEIQLEIAHVLFIDIVGYSKLLINEQHELLEELNQIVRTTEAFRAAEAAGKLIRLPTGDGMALAFATTPDAPVQCALEISKALESRPELRVRMGIHSGPVSGLVDVNDRSNIAGAGINMAQRVMDCGDAGHILLSRHVAEDLEQYRQWQPYLHDLGECEVKHGVRVHVVNFYTEEVGNPETPEKFRQSKETQTAPATPVSDAKPAGRSRAMIAALIIIVAAVAAGSYIFSHRSGSKVLPSSNASATPAILEKSIAVLPFENLSEEKANAYFADGIQDEILTRLSKIADLKVISRTSTQKYKSAPDNLREIAHQLGVSNILEGSVQKESDQVRVSVQLIDVRNDSHLWTETYDRKLTDIFGVESDVAKSIAQALQAKLSGHEEQAFGAKPTTNPDAYDAYLRGLAAEGESIRSVYPIQKAISFYKRAVHLDPNFALAWSKLSGAHSSLYPSFGDSTEAAKRALETAQKLQPDSPETLLALAEYQYSELHDYDAARTNFLHVSKMLPGNSEIPAALAQIARHQGNWEEAVAYYEQALVLDPRNVELLTETADNYDDLRRFDNALKLYDRALEIRPNDIDLLASKAGIYQAQGNLTQAARCLEGVNALTPSYEAVPQKVDQLIFERNYPGAVQLLETRFAQFQFGSELEVVAFQDFLASSRLLAGDTAGAKAIAEQVAQISQ